ncbi:hypothetical protein CISECK367B_23450 [Citrobacter sedlakii]
MSRDRYNLSIAVFVLLLKDNEICMLRRGNTGWMDGYFSLPAGGLEQGEPLFARSDQGTEGGDRGCCIPF